MAKDPLYPNVTLPPDFCESYPTPLTSCSNPIPTAPAFVSAEIGVVNGSTVAVTFNAICVTVPDVTIKEDGVTTTHDGGTIQGDAHIVYYVIPIPWHGLDSVMTVDNNPVTNNIIWLSQMDLQADTQATAAAWLDQSIHHRDFTQADLGARPVVTTHGSKAIVIPDAVDDWMDGEIFADDLEQLMIIAVLNQTEGVNNGIVIGKINVDTDWLYNGWEMLADGHFAIYQNPNGGDYRQQSWGVASNPNPSSRQNNIFTVKKLGNSETDVHLYLNGVLNDGGTNPQGDPITSFSNSETVKLWVESGVNGVDDNGFGGTKVSAIMMLVPCPPAADQAALEVRVGLRYAETPEFVSGLASAFDIDFSYVQITFSVNISASDFMAGSIIKVNDISQAIDHAELDLDPYKVKLFIPSGQSSEDVFTYEYSGGNIVSTLYGVPLGTVTPQVVTNGF